MFVEIKRCAGGGEKQRVVVLVRMEQRFFRAGKEIIEKHFFCVNGDKQAFAVHMRIYHTTTENTRGFGCSTLACWERDREREGAMRRGTIFSAMLHGRSAA